MRKMSMVVTVSVADDDLTEGEVQKAVQAALDHLRPVDGKAVVHKPVVDQL